MTIDIADLKAHLNITFDADDALLAIKIAAATGWIEAFTGCSFKDYEDGIPDPLLEAVRQLAGHLYENREATISGVTSAEIPFGVHELIQPYRDWVF